MSLKELAAHVGMSDNMVRQLMSFWVHKGVVQEKKSQATTITRKSLQTLAYFTSSEQQDLSSLYYVPVKIYEGTQGDSNKILLILSF